MVELIQKQFKCIGSLDDCMSGTREAKDEFDELDRKLQIESDDFIETFFDLARIDDEKLRIGNMLGLARNLLRDYEKDGTFENLPIFLENLVEIVRNERGL